MTAAPARSLLERWSARRLALWAFPIVLWLVATFALGGALGKSTDDYSTNLRDPVTAELTNGFRPFAEYSYFWRPAHVWLIHALQSYLYEYDRLIHAWSAVAHGLVALLLFVLARRVTRSPIAAALAAMLFLLLPVHYEALFFTATISTLIASALFLWLAIAMTRDAARPPQSRRVWHIGAMAIIALAIPFFYEQAGAAIAALPLVWWAGAARHAASSRRKLALVRPLVLTAILGSTQLIMAWALLATAPAGRRGSGASIRPLSQWPDSYTFVAARTLDLIVGERADSVIRGSLPLARTLLTSTVLWVWLVPLVLTAFAWMLSVWRQPAAVHGDQPRFDDVAPARSRQASLCMLTFGLAAAALAIAPPALVSGQGVPARLTYVPALGLALAFSGAAALVLGSLPARSRPWVIRLAAPLLAVTLAIGAFALMGCQRWFQQRAAADANIARQLQRLFPDPPPQSIFVPVRIDHTTTRTGDPHFDRLRPGAFETIWSATALTRQTFRRRDLWCAGWNPWRQPVISNPDAHGVQLNDRFVIWSPFPPAGSGTHVPWANMIPFVVDSDGRVRLVRQFTDTSVQPPRIFEPALVLGEMRSKRLRRANTELISLPSLQTIELPPAPPSAPAATP